MKAPLEAFHIERFDTADRDVDDQHESLDMSEYILSGEIELNSSMKSVHKSTSASGVASIPDRSLAQTLINSRSQA